MTGIASARVVVTGTGAACGTCDATQFVKTRKLRKFMGKQDELAVLAAGQALESAGLAGPLGERCGLYLAVGYIPFERTDMDQLLDASLDGETFSMGRFAANAFGAINPLLTFRVLPNMPAFHVSLNFDIQGPYIVSYPGAGQFYGVLEEAIAAVDRGAIDIALVGAVADQENVLVEHHFSRVPWPVEASRLKDAAAFLVVEREDDSIARGATTRARLLEYQMEYAPVDPFTMTAPSESVLANSVQLHDTIDFGPSSLGIALARATPGRMVHQVRTRDGFIAASTWEVA